MNNKTLKIALICAMGGLIGTFIGLRFASTLGLIASIASGAITAYLSYEIRNIPAAASRAFALTFKRQRQKRVSLRTNFWRYRSRIVVLGSFVATEVSFMCTILGTHTPSTTMLKNYILGIALGWFIALCGVTVILKSFCRTFDPKVDYTKKVSEIPLNLRKELGWFYYYVQWYGPLLWPLIMAIQLSLAIGLGIGFLWTDVLAKMPRFLKLCIYFIHSEARMICLVDAGIGAGIGYLFHSPVIGGVVGAIFGIVNYWIVSIKILKLKPKF